MADNIPTEPDRRRFAPATQRNRDPILSVLAPRLTAARIVLEVASGSGEHAIWLASHLSHLTWLPSDPDPQAVASIAAWIAESGADNVAAPRLLDVTMDDWPLQSTEQPLDAIFSANMLHIAPWIACLGLCAGAGRYLRPSGQLLIYGPFLRHGVPTAEGNRRFDAQLRQQNPDWGIRDLDEVATAARAAGLELEEVVEMPANNLIVCFRRRAE